MEKYPILKKIFFAFFIAISSLAFTIAIYNIFSRGIDKQEKVECLAWQKQAKEYPAYYITKWQEKQCNAHNIIINAPVK